MVKQFVTHIRFKKYIYLKASWCETVYNKSWHLNTNATLNRVKKKNEQIDRFFNLQKKRTKTNHKRWFWSNFVERFAPLLFYHERPERIAQCCSFEMSTLSDLLTVALFKSLLTWATWAICSQSLSCPDGSEQIAHSLSDLSNLSNWAMRE